ncbi:MAG: hypothetical protein NVS2B8_17070 [Vulcanimicrobiaceae bacterium]
MCRRNTPAPCAEPLGINAIDWVAGCGLVYGALFGIGKIVLGDAAQGAAYLALATACGALITYNVTRAERASAAARAARATATL